jgi:hypothetical protein
MLFPLLVQARVTELQEIEADPLYAWKRAIRSTIALLCCAARPTIDHTGRVTMLPFVPTRLFPGYEFEETYPLPSKVDDGLIPYDYHSSHKQIDPERYLSQSHSCEQIM